MNSKMIFMDPKLECGDEYFPNLYNLKIKSGGEDLIGFMLTSGEKGDFHFQIALKMLRI